jgi:NAD(P)-dependent dehydrogenase (short-subunit alcohol dehydrogenase family)
MSTAPEDRDARIAVVTGGSGGIGGAIVSRLRSRGHRTVVIDRTGGIDCDLSSEQSTREAAEQVISEYGRCDVLVHSAAAFDLADLAHLDARLWRHVQAVNVESVLWLTQAFVPEMANRGFGRIIFVVSDTIWSPPGEAMLAYVASKGALIGVMRTLAVSLGDSGIAVSVVAPGLTDTPGSRTANTEADFDSVVQKQALNRRLTPEDTAAAVAYLASDEGVALTGQVLCLDGGLILR